jgi:hypothetical protein
MESVESKDKKSKNTLRHALRLAYDDLEKRIEEQTSELLIINKELKQEITERRRAEDLLHYRIELEKLITKMSTDFIRLSSEKIPAAMQKALKIIGEFVCVDCSYVFQINIHDLAITTKE